MNVLILSVDEKAFCYNNILLDFFLFNVPTYYSRTTFLFKFIIHISTLIFIGFF